MVEAVSCEKCFRQVEELSEYVFSQGKSEARYNTCACDTHTETKSTGLQLHTVYCLKIFKTCHKQDIARPRIY